MIIAPVLLLLMRTLSLKKSTLRLDEVVWWLLQNRLTDSPTITGRTGLSQKIRESSVQHSHKTNERYLISVYYTPDKKEVGLGGSSFLCMIEGRSCSNHNDLFRRVNLMSSSPFQPVLLKLMKHNANTFDWIKLYKLFSSIYNIKRRKTFNYSFLFTSHLKKKNLPCL